MAQLLLDISRTVARARLPAPTGIDRVERAYIQWVLDRGGAFLAGFDGFQHLVGPETVRELVGWLDNGQRAPGLDLRSQLRPQRDQRLRRAQSLIRRKAVQRCRADELPGENLKGIQTYLNVGHDNLDPAIVNAVRKAGVRTAVLIHDTIPLDHPEFTRDGAGERFARFLNTAGQSDLVLANSAHTASRLSHYLPQKTAITAPLGIERSATATSIDGKASFLILGTIEPRKNHAMLLDIWEGFGTGPSVPHLHIVGRRGWKNERLFQRLDTSPIIADTVHELGPLDDIALAMEVASARAVLFPSFAEGYGLPLGEALAAGTPVIASDLSALRDVGKDVPEYLPPDDQDAWRKSIKAYADPRSVEREAQLKRLGGWTAPTWSQHFQIVEAALQEIAT